MESRRGRRGLLVALVGAASVAVVGVLLSGPLRIGTGLPISITPFPAPSASAQSAAPRMPTPSPEIVHTAQVVAVVVAVIAGLLILAIVVAAIAWAVRRIPRLRLLLERPTAPDAIEAGAGRVADAPISAPVVRRGLERALEILESPGGADDAVVEAWIGLEDAAVLAGAPRRPSETPSEYAARIIRRFEADRDAADELRRLYERVRFGGDSVDPAAIEVARGCLRRLLASWNSDAPVETGAP